MYWCGNSPDLPVTSGPGRPANGSIAVFWRIRSAEATRTNSAVAVPHTNARPTDLPHDILGFLPSDSDEARPNVHPWRYGLRKILWRPWSEKRAAVTAL